MVNERKINIWRVFWHRYLNDNPEKYGKSITLEELLQQTSFPQQKIEFGERINDERISR